MITFCCFSIIIIIIMVDLQCICGGDLSHDPTVVCYCYGIYCLCNARTFGKANIS